MPDAVREIADWCLKQDQSKQLQVKAGKRTIVLSFSPGTAPSYVNIYGRDITKENLLRAQLQQSQKLESIGTLGQWGSARDQQPDHGHHELRAVDPGWDG